jgi:hypothetical protein
VPRAQARTALSACGGESSPLRSRLAQGATGVPSGSSAVRRLPRARLPDACHAYRPRHPARWRSREILVGVQLAVVMCSLPWDKNCARGRRIWKRTKLTANRDLPIQGSVTGTLTAVAGSRDGSYRFPAHGMTAKTDFRSARTLCHWSVSDLGSGRLRNRYCFSRCAVRSGRGVRVAQSSVRGEHSGRITHNSAPKR